MRALTARKGRSELGQQRDMSEVIADLLELTKDAELLKMHRVVICLQYAYWEALCEMSPQSPLN